MSDVWKSVNFLIRCDEEALRMVRRLKSWTDGVGKIFVKVADGLPHIERDLRSGERSMREMKTLIVDDATYSGNKSSRSQVVRTMVQLIHEHQRDEQALIDFNRYFEVVHEVQTALSSLANLMDDVECFSVNAIVQAHNAGDRGRGFSQVSREVVNLTKRASVEFSQVRALATQIEENIRELTEEVGQSQSNFKASMVQSEDDVNGLFANLDGTRDKVITQVETLIAGISDSNHELASMLASMQFGDQCARTATQLADSLNLFHEQVTTLAGRDSNPQTVAADVERIMDSVWLGLGVFEQVEQRVEQLDNGLSQSRTEFLDTLEKFSQELQQRAEIGVDLNGLETAIHDCRERLDNMVDFMRTMVEAKGNIVTRVQSLADQIRDLRDGLGGVRRTAKRFGVMASIIKVELASAGLSEEFGDALSADRVENLYRDMASAVGSVLISMDSAVKQVQRHSAKFRRALVWEEDALRDAEAHTRSLVNDLDQSLIRTLKQGEHSFHNVLLSLNREVAQLRTDVAQNADLTRMSNDIRSDASARLWVLRECQTELLSISGLDHWDIRDQQARKVLSQCTRQQQNNGEEAGRGKLDEPISLF